MVFFNPLSIFDKEKFENFNEDYFFCERNKVHINNAKGDLYFRKVNKVFIGGEVKGKIQIVDAKEVYLHGNFTDCTIALSNVGLKAEFQGNFKNCQIATKGVNAIDCKGIFKDTNSLFVDSITVEMDSIHKNGNLYFRNNKALLLNLNYFRVKGVNYQPFDNCHNISLKGSVPPFFSQEAKLAMI